MYVSRDAWICELLKRGYLKLRQVYLRLYTLMWWEHE